MQPTKSKKEWEQEFKLIYIDILKRAKSYDDLVLANEEGLNQFKQEYTLDNNSIEFLPAYFNFIECFLAQNNKLGEVKKYLIVGLTNLLNASKKSDEKTYEKKEEFDQEEIYKKLLQSRLDLLFGRYNLMTRAPVEQTIDKLNSSIITYSEIYGPENVGLTPQYYYLADYFLDYSDPEEKMKRIIVKKIYVKIADLWRQYFNDMVNPKFLFNDDTELLYAIGETYVKMINNRISNVFTRNSETELDLKFRMIKVVLLKRTGSDFYPQALNSVNEFKEKVADKILDKDYMSDLEKHMKNDEQ